MTHCCFKNGDEESQELKFLTTKKACTDIVGLVAFLIFWIAMIIICGVGFYQGNINRILYPTDSYGNICNIKNDNSYSPFEHLTGLDMSNKPLLFMYFNQSTGRVEAICVEDCPKAILTNQAELKLFEQNHQVSLSLTYQPSGRYPALPIIPSTEKVGYCLPRPEPVFSDHLRFFVPYINGRGSMGRNMLYDLYKGWIQFFLIMLLSIVLSILMMLLMRKCSSLVIGSLIVFAIVSLAALTGTMWWVFASTRSILTSQVHDQIPLLAVDILAEVYFYAFGIICIILLVAMVCIIILHIRRYVHVCALWKEAGYFLQQVRCSLFYPFITVGALCALDIFCLLAIAYLGSTGEPTPGHVYLAYSSGGIRYLCFYVIIGLLWTSQFIISCQQIVFSSAVSRWYFSRDKSTLQGQLGASVRELLRYHLGTAAFGALVLPLLRIPRSICNFIHWRSQPHLKCSHCFSRCDSCGLCVRVISKHAYIVTAAEGTSLCSSTRKAHKIMTGTRYCVTLLNDASDFVFWLCKMSISATCATLLTVWLKESDYHFFAVPSVLVAIMAYFVADAFFSVQEMTVNAMLLCFCEDVRMNDRSLNGTHYFFSSSLLELVAKSNQKLPTLKTSSVHGERQPALREEEIKLEMKGVHRTSNGPVSHYV